MISICLVDGTQTVYWWIGIKTSNLFRIDIPDKFYNTLYKYIKNVKTVK